MPLLSVGEKTEMFICVYEAPRALQSPLCTGALYITPISGGKIKPEKCMCVYVWVYKAPWALQNPSESLEAS